LLKNVSKNQCWPSFVFLKNMGIINEKKSACFLFSSGFAKIVLLIF